MDLIFSDGTLNAAFFLATFFSLLDIFFLPTLSQAFNTPFLKVFHKSDISILTSSFTFFESYSFLFGIYSTSTFFFLQSVPFSQPFLEPFYPDLQPPATTLSRSVFIQLTHSSFYDPFLSHNYF